MQHHYQVLKKSRWLIKVESFYKIHQINLHFVELQFIWHEFTYTALENYG